VIPAAFLYGSIWFANNRETAPRGKLKGLNIAGKPEFALLRRASKKNGPYGLSDECVSGDWGL